MFDAITRMTPADADFPARTQLLDLLRRVLDGTLYDALPYSFQEERGAGGEYIPLRNRRPSVRYPLSRIVVSDSVSLLFGDGHFPTLDCADHGGLAHPHVDDIPAAPADDDAAEPCANIARCAEGDGAVLGHEETPSPVGPALGVD